jgi:cytochrome P450
MSTTDDKLHQKRRAQASPAFSGKEIESTIDDHVNKFLSLIRRRYLSSETQTKVMDLATKVQYFALDVVMDIATGQPFEDLMNDKDMYDFLESSASSLPVIAMVAAVPWAGKLLQSRWIAPLVAPTASEYGIGKVIEYVCYPITLLSHC